MLGTINLKCIRHSKLIHYLNTNNITGNKITKVISPDYNLIFI